VRAAGQDRLREVTTLVGYPGPPGTHSAAASVVLAPDGARTVDLPSFIAVVEATVATDVALGVLPIESSLVGPVAETHDLLYDAPLSIVREASLPIRHCLVARARADVSQFKTIRSHPVAFDQCRRAVSELSAKLVAAATTAHAAREVAESDDPTEAAIASPEAAAEYGLEIVVDDVSDHPEAFTRFVAIAPYTRVEGSHEGWRTAISFVTDHRPGALYRALEPFARHDLNMVQLVSRPLVRSRWRYRFDVVFDGHPLDGEVRIALGELRALTRAVRVVGCYPAEVSR
jgi:prephenate dehydratase